MYIFSVGFYNASPPELLASTTSSLLNTTSCPQIRETRQSMRDSESGLERLAIGHHIWDRGHVMERSRNRHTGDREERQDYINLEESKSRGYMCYSLRFSRISMTIPMFLTLK